MVLHDAIDLERSPIMHLQIWETHEYNKRTARTPGTTGLYSIAIRPMPRTARFQRQLREVDKKTMLFTKDTRKFMVLPCTPRPS